MAKMYDFETLARARMNLVAHIKGLQDELEEKLKPLEEQLELLELQVMRQMDSMKITSTSTSYGDMIRTTKTTPRGVDWGAFSAWVLENGRTDFYQHRLNSAEVNAWIEANAGAVPPGIEQIKEPKLVFRKPRKKASK